MTRRRTLLAGLAAAPLLPGLATAQGACPSRTIRIVAPFSPSGGTDILARLLGAHDRWAFGQSAVVENLSGGARGIGLREVQRAEPDGHTLMVASTGGIMGLAGHDGERTFPVRDELTPITPVAAPAYVVTVHPSLGVRDAAGLIALARRRPGQLSFDSSGTGAASDLAAELFASRAGIALLHVPYRGAGPALNALVAGRISMMFAPPQTAAPAVSAGQVHNIAITSDRRLPLMADLPTAAETGLPGSSAVGWFGLFGPRGMPAPIVTRPAEEAERGLSAAATRERLAALGAVPEPMTPDAFNDFVNADAARWQRLARARTIPPE